MEDATLGSAQKREGLKKAGYLELASIREWIELRDMTSKAEKLLPKIERAGIKASLKAGHVVSREELLEVKVQLMPTLLRWTLGGFSAAAAYGSYLQFSAGNLNAGFGFVLLALLFLFFAWVGIRKTLANLLEGLSQVDYAQAGDLVGTALVCIAEAVGSAFD
ncbi:hypothetical protein EI77_04453 [Prosthecobacter fusiformis]|uniref:Uncharacterized protein n=1 Tax=Prosthecobacter fusiformis TaxID=48464 RepID=A0A4R7RK58_9BACT|nr:hypothetical protein [Prosthecobacter fusiformis]TDU63132.1 hypothetical protein EI77_04453 [Prosthecobacter fusiformis]